MRKQYKRLWSVVRRLIIENYKTILERSIRGVRGSRGIRASYYIVGDLLAPLIGKEISQEDYNWYLTDQGYASYRDDIWPKIEQEHGLERPPAKAIGIVFDHGNEYTVKRLTEVWDQARGFIFVEKSGEAEDIQELSDYGWTIVAGQGYPTRLVRRLLKDDTRPVLTLHDWDRDGRGVYRALGFKTRRTAHLDIALGKRVTDLGLHEEHVKVLDLPSRPSPPKYKGRPRVELSSLNVLVTRWGLENPVLAYTVAAMLASDLTLSPTELPKKELAERHIRWLLTEGLQSVVNAAIEWVMKQTEIEGSAVEAVLVKKMYTVPGLREKLIEVAMQFFEKIEWRGQEHYHHEALGLTNEKLVSLLRGS